MQVNLFQPNKMQILASILKGNIVLIDTFDMNQIGYLNEKITIKPSHIRNMLKRYLAGEISDYELNQWARFICLRTEYTVPSGEDEDDYTISDFYENMYYVIQRVSTPEIDGDITEELIKEYLNELDTKYPTDPPEELCK